MARFHVKPAFCACIARGLKPGEAARAVGITRATAYRWRSEDAAFAGMWEAALDERTEEAESQLFKLVRESNLGAIMFALKHWKPALYDRRVKVSLDTNSQIANQTGEANSRIRFYKFRLPENGRDKPEPIEADTQLAIEPPGREEDTA